MALERLQAAIAKARAARTSGEPVADPLVAVSQENAIQAAWAALPELVLSPRRLEAGRIFTHSAGPAATEFDMMRTNLLHQLREHKWSRVAITSPGVACGKTTTCLNLAFSLARQSDLRVVVLEMDLRRPTMTKTLGLKGQFRFATALEGTEPPDQHLMRYGENLAFGLNTIALQSPAELLSSSRASAVVDAIETRLAPDVMLFDMPPALVSDDTQAFLDQVDCTLVIAAAERSTLSEIDRCGSELAKYTQVLGVVLNKCRFVGRTDDYGAPA